MVKDEEEEKRLSIEVGKAKLKEKVIVLADHKTRLLDK